jgi:hypothetical protein
MGACGETAFNAGCELMRPCAAKKPGYEMPHIPTFPLLLGMCFTSQSAVS